MPTLTAGGSSASAWRFLRAAAVPPLLLPAATEGAGGGVYSGTGGGSGSWQPGEAQGWPQPACGVPQGSRHSGAPAAAGPGQGPKWQGCLHQASRAAN